MKKCNLLFMFAPLIMATSCNKDNFMELSQDRNSFLNPMAYVGELHNQALGLISTESVTMDSICSFANNFVESKISDSHSSRNPTELSELTLSIAKRIGIERYESYNTRGESSSETADSLYNEIPLEWKSYIDEMKNIILSDEVEETVVADKLKKIDISIGLDSNLSAEDKMGLWSCSAITYASYVYNIDLISTRAVTAEGVVRADFEGAIGGFLSWRFWGKTAAGLMFGPQGAVIAATKEIVKGAIVSSGVNVVSGLIW